MRDEERIGKLERDVAEIRREVQKTGWCLVGFALLLLLVQLVHAGGAR